MSLTLPNNRKISREDFEQAKVRSREENLHSDFAQQVIKMFVHPDEKCGFKLVNGELISENGFSIPVHNGIPDFTVFAAPPSAEKIQQTEFHNNEKKEPLVAIALRPYHPYNRFHVESWLLHLQDFKKRLSSTMGITLQGTTVLNCGCGGGFEAQFLAENGAKVVGFDIAQLRAEAAAVRFQLNELADGFFYRGDATILPFADNSFDLVLYHDSLHHVPIEEIPLAIREAVRVSRRAVVLLEAHDSPIRSLLESLGFSFSIENAGNYVFRFRKSLMMFWAMQTSTELVNYSVNFMKKEHGPNWYAKRFIGPVIFYLVRVVGRVLRPFGNEACIILKKS